MKQQHTTRRSLGPFLVLTFVLFVYETHWFLFLSSSSSGTAISRSLLASSSGAHRAAGQGAPTATTNHNAITTENLANHSIPRKAEIQPFFRSTTDEDWVLSPDDPLLSRSEWDLSPIVIPEFQLIFFTQAKIGCTVWKQLFRRMMGLPDWAAENCCDLLPWNPRQNGLTYLYHYDRNVASSMLRDDNWTKAIFVRDPVERFVSAWLDKAVRNDSFLQTHCCDRYQLEEQQCIDARTSMAAFIQLVRVCDNPHWRPQSHRLPHASYWQFMTFTGHMESVADDAERLLRTIGAWDAYGASGWGDNHGGGDSNGTTAAATVPDDQAAAIFRGTMGRHHATSAQQRMREYISADLEHQLRTDLYVNDYEHPNITTVPELRRL
jgi:Sulfotransferase family